MDWASQSPLLLEALAGAAVAHVIAALTRGGRGILTRTIAGVAGGLAVGQGVMFIPAARPALDLLYGAVRAPWGQPFAEIALGAAGGALAGLVIGLIWRPQH